MLDPKIPARVLIVDDEALIRWALAESLRTAGFDTVEAGSLSAAQRLIVDGAEPIDAALVDLRLPDGSGLSVLEHLQASRPGCPSILMTAYGSEGSADEATKRGAVAVVSKPFDLGDIMRLLSTALEGRTR
jgi:DNA-binding NtrC family response regulator